MRALDHTLGMTTVLRAADSAAFLGIVPSQRFGVAVLGNRFVSTVPPVARLLEAPILQASAG